MKTYSEMTDNEVYGALPGTDRLFFIKRKFKDRSIKDAISEASRDFIELFESIVSYVEERTTGEKIVLRAHMKDGNQLDIEFFYKKDSVGFTIPSLKDIITEYEQHVLDDEFKDIVKAITGRNAFVVNYFLVGFFAEPDYNHYHLVRETLLHPPIYLGESTVLEDYRIWDSNKCRSFVKSNIVTWADSLFKRLGLMEKEDSFVEKKELDDSSVISDDVVYKSLWESLKYKLMFKAKQGHLPNILLIAHNTYNEETIAIMEFFTEAEFETEKEKFDKIPSQPDRRVSL